MDRALSLPALTQDLSLPYRFQEATAPAKTLLLLLHGVGSNETSLAGLLPLLPETVSIALVRSPFPMGQNAFRAFSVDFTAQGPVINAEEAEASRQLLLRFVGELQARTGISAQNTLIAGFSQGGIMSAGLALTQPDTVAVFGIISGRILPQIEPLIASQDKLQHLHGLILHGEQDGTLPVTWADNSAALLQAHHVPFTLHKFQARHEITAAMAQTFADWVKTFTEAAAQS
ncbi:MAG TPA: phospholipase [Rhodocyclaceae bacterium]|jgi:phospholipase/carboxylesterase